MERTRLTHLRTILFLIYVGCIHDGLGQGDTVILTPLGFNASLSSNTIITFRCTIEGMNVNWLVNNQSPGPVGVGIVVSSAAQSGDFIASNLSVPAREENDNITIVCFRFNVGVDSLVSPTAIFRVQGLLESPSNLTRSEFNATHRQLTWSAPFTLDITDEDPDISGYSVCDNVTGSCEMVTETEYTYLNLQVPVEFTVSALNVVGEGNASTVIHDPCNPDEDPANLNGSLIQTSVLFTEGNPITTFKFSLEITCFSVYMIETTEDSTNSSIVLNGPFIPTVIGEEGSVITLAVSVNSSLTLNAVHNASIIAVSVAGSAPSTGMIQFTTFDVQEVSVSVNPGSITITCTFAKGSLANGCHVILRAENVTDIAMNISREEQSGGQLSQTAAGQASDLEIGTYEITVSDLESDNTIGLPNPIQIVTVSVTEVQPSPTTPTGTPSSPTTGPNAVSPGSENTTAIIAGAAIGSVILILGLGILFMGIWILYRRKGDKHRKKKGHVASQYEPIMRDRTSAIYNNNSDKPNDPPYAQPTLTPELSRKHNSLQGSKRSHDSTDSPAHSSHLPPGLPALPPLPPEASAPPKVHYESLDESIRGSMEQLTASSELEKAKANPIYAEPSSPTQPPPPPPSLPPGPPFFTHLSVNDNATVSRQSTQSAYSLAPEVPPQNFTEEDIRELNLSLSEIAQAGSQQSLSDSSSSLLSRLIPPPHSLTASTDAVHGGSTRSIPSTVPPAEDPLTSPPPLVPPQSFSEGDVGEITGDRPDLVEMDEASRQLDLEVEKLTALADEMGETTSAL